MVSGWLKKPLKLSEKAVHMPQRSYRRSAQYREMTPLSEVGDSFTQELCTDIRSVFRP